MRTYSIASVPSIEAICWDKIDKAMVDSYGWLNNGYEPRTYAQVVLVPDYGFVARMTSEETNPRAEYKNTDDFVCQDSCVEFFAQYVEGDDRYVNIEVNAIGTILSYIGPDRYERESVRTLTGETFEVLTDRTDSSWSVTVKIPFEKLRQIYGIDSTDRFCSGYTIRGNFYKCGDFCQIPHYGMWNPVMTEIPDFHRPEYFGLLQIQ